MTRYFLVTHKAGAYQNDTYYPPAEEGGDLTQSIVPLEIDKDAKAPNWGIECDRFGRTAEQIEAEQRESIEDKMATEFANRIAANAGQGTINPPAKTETADDKAAEQRKSTIVAALGLLEHDNDDHWTARGEPAVSVVEQVSGLTLTRAEIEAAAPDVVRKK